MQLPDTWAWVALGDLDKTKRRTIDPEKYPNELFEYYSIPAYQENQTPSVARGRDIGSVKLLLEPNSVLFGKLNPRVEKVWRVRATAGLRQIGSTEWLPIVPSEQVDPNFLYFVCWSDRVMRVAKGQVSGSTPSRQRVDATAFYRIRIPLPPLAEQRQIAEILLAVQQATGRQQRLVSLATELKRAAMYKLFSEGIRGEPLKETNIGVVPESWTIVECQRLAVLQRGVDLTRSDFREGIVPVAGSNGVIGQHNVANVKGPGVTVGRSGSVGKVTYYAGDFWAHNTCLYVKDFCGNDPRYTAFHLEYLDLGRFRSGASVPTLDRNSFKTFLIALPPRAEQKMIAEALTAVQRKIEISSLHKASYESLFTTLLHKLITGQVRVQDLDLTELADSAAIAVA
jgi:type I restriction enzyme S subunit